jgi:DNA-binding transcriptional regulator LsrR (DeoR family)
LAEGNSQKEIADQTRISTSTISHMKKQAERLGFLKTELKLAIPKNFELGARLAALFNPEVSKPVVRVVKIERKGEEVLRAVGIECAKYLERIIRNDYTMAYDYGRASYHTITSLQSHRRGIKIYPLAAGYHRSIDPYTSMDGLLVMLHAKFHGLDWKFHFLPLPSQTIQEDMEKNPEIGKILREAEKANIMHIGVGGIASQTFRHNIERMGMDLDRFIGSGAIGTCVSTAFDRDGNVVRSEFDERFFKVAGESIKEAAGQKGRHVLLSACGSDKVDCIRALMRGGWMNVLITDQKTAEEILGKE